MITGFDSIRDFLRFASAREFWVDDDPPHKFEYPPNLLERIGRGIIKPSFGTGDRVLKHITEPHVVTALALAALAGVTFLFYPDLTSEVVVRVIPITKSIEPWMIKFAGFIASQATILGVGWNILGRLYNQTLMQAWKDKQIVPIPLGAVMRNPPQNQ